MAGSNVTFGIVPYGSGNGLSRFLGIPLNTKKAIKNLMKGHIEIIDSGSLNGMPFFNMAGMGFDAHISEVFSHGKTRGFFNYIKSSIREFSNYKAQNYVLNIDGVVYQREIFMLSFANSSQYGNNAHISPQASVHDGLIDVCIIKKFPLWRLLEMGLRMLTKTSEGTKYVEIIRGREIQIQREGPGPVHIDGEPRVCGKICHVMTVPSSLKIIVGSNFRPGISKLK